MRKTFIKSVKNEATRSRFRPQPKKRPDKIHPRRIVILDDEPSVRVAHEKMFRYLMRNASPLEIVTIADGGKAMRELSRENPDLFITDQRHPGMKCDEMFNVLAQRQINYPILVITAGASATRKKELSKLSRELGLTINLLAKPYLVEELRRFLGRYFHLSPCSPSDKSGEEPSGFSD